MSSEANITAPQRKYAVFISYKHADNKETGRQWASWLHQTLETYEIPKDLAGKKNDAGETIPSSLYPVFRDEEELSASADLNQSIRRALENTSLLVVICSPLSAQSKYVQDEIRYFKDLGKASRILALMINGEPNSENAPQLECLPEPLRFGVPREDGTIDWSARVKDWILADTRVDGKPQQGWTTGAAYREALEHEKKWSAREINARVHDYEKRLELAKLKIISGALGVPLGTITARDKEWQLQQARARARRLRRMVAGFAALTIAAIIAGVVALREKNAAVQALSNSDFLQAGRFITTGSRGDALAYLTRSISENPKNEAAIVRLTTLLTSHSWMLPVLIFPHSNVVEYAQFSPDGTKVVTASDDGTARIWDAQTGHSLTNPLRHHGFVWSAQFSPDGKKIVTGCDDGTAQVWDVKTGQPLLPQPLQHSNKVGWVQFSPDGKKIVTASDDGTARIWDAQTGKPLTGFMRHTGIVEYVEFSPDGKKIITASDDRTAGIWDAETGARLFQLQHGDIVWSAHFSSNGDLAVTASSDNTARIWDVHTGKLLVKPLQHGAWVVSARFSPDGKKVVTASWNNTAQLWDALTGAPIGEPMKHDSAVNSADFSPDGKKIVTASLDYTARIWDAQTGKPITEPMKQGNLGWIAQFSPDGKRILTASFDGSAKIWEAISAPASAEPLQHQKTIFAMQFSPDGKRIITGSYDHTARVWDVGSGTNICASLLHNDTIRSVQFSPDGKLVATGSDDGTVRIWDARTGQAQRLFQHSNAVECATFSPDGTKLATASMDGTAQMWDVKTGSHLFTVSQSNAIWTVQFSRDGKKFITGAGDCDSKPTGPFSTNGTAQIWDAQTGSPLTPPMHRDGAVVSVQFSPDGKRVVTGGWDNTARIWDARTGQPISPPLRHGNKVMSAQFSPDGKLVVTAGLDHKVCVWNADTGQLAIEPLIHPDPVWTAHFSPDGKWIVTGSRDHFVRLWDTETGQPLMEPLQQVGSVYLAEFNPNGKQVAIAATNDAARIQDIAPSARKFPDWLLPLAEAVSGEGLNSQGRLELIATNRFEMLQQIQQRLNQLPDDDGWITWGRWFLTVPGNRTISPFSKMTIPEYVENRMNENTIPSLDEAQLAAFGNTNLLQHISQMREALKESTQSN